MWGTVPLRRRSIRIQGLHPEKTIKTSSRRRTVTLVSSFVDFGSRATLCFWWSSPRVIDSLSVECFSRFPLCFPPCSSARSLCLPVGSTPNVKDRPLGFHPTSSFLGLAGFYGRLWESSAPLLHLSMSFERRMCLLLGVLHRHKPSRYWMISWHMLLYSIFLILIRLLSLNVMLVEMD